MIIHCIFLIHSQVLGFILLIAGMFLYNDVIIMPNVRHYLEHRRQLKDMSGTERYPDDDDERARLINGKLLDFH